MDIRRVHGLSFPISGSYNRYQFNARILQKSVYIGLASGSSAQCDEILSQPKLFLHYIITSK